MNPDIPDELAAAQSAQADTCLFVVDEAWIKGDVDFIRSATPGRETFVAESPFGVTTIFVLTSEGPLLIVAGDPVDPEDGPLKIFSAMPLWNDRDKHFCWGVPALLSEDEPGMHHAYVVALFYSDQVSQPQADRQASVRNRAMTIDLPDDELAAVIAALRQTIADDKYPLSPRLDPLRAALARLEAAGSLKTKDQAPSPSKGEKRTRR